MWTEEKIQYLKDNYGKITRRELSKVLEIPEHIIYKKTKELNICFKSGKNPTGTKHFSRRKVYLNDNFFEIPNLLNSYWAGFIAADGNIRKDEKELNIQIGQKDVEHLERFIKDIEFDGKMSVYTRKNDIKMCNAHFPSSKIVTDLKNNFNIIPRKSLVLNPPQNLTNEQKDAYIIGYIDGDGCIRKFKTKHNEYISIDSRGTLEINQYIRTRIIEILEPNKEIFGNRFNYGAISYEKKDKQESKNHCRFKITGKASIILIEHFSKYNVPFLKRKWAVEDTENK